jgi:hypothetical protein
MQHSIILQTYALKQSVAICAMHRVLAPQEG